MLQFRQLSRKYIDNFVASSPLSNKTFLDSPPGTVVHYITLFHYKHITYGYYLLLENS